MRIHVGCELRFEFPHTRVRYQIIRTLQFGDARALRDLPRISAGRRQTVMVIHDAPKILL
jgi:hypothetical protein